MDHSQGCQVKKKSVGTSDTANDLTQTLYGNKSLLYKTTSGYSSICNVVRFLEHEEKWISDSIHHTWQFREMVVQGGKWIRFAMWPDVVKWAAGPRSCISCQYSWSLQCEPPACEIRAEMIVCVSVDNANPMLGGKIMVCQDNRTSNKRWNSSIGMNGSI